ncbi:transketolase [Planctomycetota bacterium]
MTRGPDVMESLDVLKDRADWVRKETLKLHKLAPETRLASSLSDVEIFVVLYYAGILKYDPRNVLAEDRDRFFISKGHGAISLYPILAERGFFDQSELQKIGSEDSFLGVIPDALVPGFETINGALGHGLGVACGSALALKRKESDATVFVLSGDGELNSGAVWEAVMFAAYHGLNNLILIVDNNGMSMLGHQRDILDLEPLGEKFQTFEWKAETVDGHDIEQLYSTLIRLKREDGDRPKVLIANTKKGKGIRSLENDSLCHVRMFKPQEVDRILEEWQ